MGRAEMGKKGVAIWKAGVGILRSYPKWLWAEMGKGGWRRYGVG